MPLANIGSTALARFASAVPIDVIAGMSAAPTCDTSGLTAAKSCMATPMTCEMIGTIIAKALCSTGRMAWPTFSSVEPSCSMAGRTALNAPTAPDANDAMAGSICDAKYVTNGDTAEMIVVTAPPIVETMVSQMPGICSPSFPKADLHVPTTDAAASAIAWNAPVIWEASTVGSCMPSSAKAPTAMFQAVASASESTGPRTGPRPDSTTGNASTIPLPICATLGATFVATAPIDSSSCCVSCEKSTSSRPSPVMKFSHAAFAMPMEPLIVVAASLAVVPVMPMFSCTVWMASTTSA